MAQIIVISSLNTFSGKTLLAAHLAIMLAAEYKTAVLDSASGDSALASFIARRHNLNMSRGYNLLTPPYHTLHKETFESLNQSCDVLILDSPEEKYFKYADILLTPLHGKEGASSVASVGSMYASLVWEAKKHRAALGKNAFRWIVCPNDDYDADDKAKISSAGKIIGFQVSPRLQRRKEYAEGMKTGLTVLDKDLPDLKTLFDLPDLYARRELKKLVAFIWPDK